MHADYARVYRELYERHWWWRAREEFVVEAIRELEFRRGGRILDVGCGDGLLFPRLEEFGRVEGVEADAGAVSHEGQLRGPIHVGQFDESFQPVRRYSLILMLDVLEHLPDPVGALEHALSLLEPHGALLVTVPAFQMLWTAHDDLNGHYVRYNRRNVAELARLAGMRVDRSRYFFHWLFPVKLFYRGMQACGRRAEGHRIPGPRMNDFYYLVSRWEQKLLGRCPLPLGSSLMISGGRLRQRVRIARPARLPSLLALPQRA